MSSNDRAWTDTLPGAGSVPYTGLNAAERLRMRYHFIWSAKVS